MHFSASDGDGRSVSIWDYYEVDDSVGVSGKSSAGFSGDLSMDDSRSISGPGDIYVVQGYSGSGGYAGASYIYARDATHTLALGSSHLTPGALGVVQDVSIDGAAESAVVSTGNLEGRSAMQHAFVYGGSLDSLQTIDIDDGITTSQNTQMVGFLPTAFGTAGYMNVNRGPTNLNIEGEGAAVAVSSYDSRDGVSEVDCSLATGTGNSAWAYGDIRSATSDLGTVGAGANVVLEADWNGNLYIDGEAEAAVVGVLAEGRNNEIGGTLAAGTGARGTGAYGEDIEASNRRGTIGAAAASGGVGVDVELENGWIAGGAEAAGIGVFADGRDNEISAGTLAAGTGFFGTGAYGEDIEASNKRGTVAAAAASGGLGGVYLENEFIAGGAEAAVVGVLADGGKNKISAGTLAAGTGARGTRAYGDDLEASNSWGTVVAAATAGGLEAGADLQNGFVGGGAEAAGVGVLADGGKNKISAGTLTAGTGARGTRAYGDDIEASNRWGTVGAAAGAGGLGVDVDLQNGFVGGGAEAAGVGVLADGEKNKISAGTLTAGTGARGTRAYGDDIEASNRRGTVGAAAASGGVGVDVDLDDGFIAGGAEAAGIGVFADGRDNAIGAGTLAAGTGARGTRAYGDDIEASNRRGTVLAAAAAGGLGGVYLDDGFVAGGAEAAGVGVFADGRDNAIGAGTLAAATGFFGTGTFGDDIEASNRRGAVVAAAAAGGLGGDVDLENGNGIVGAEGAIFGAGAVGTDNQIGVGVVGASTTNSADVFAWDVEASSGQGAAGTGVAAGNLQVDLTSGTITSVTAEGSAVGAGSIGSDASASAEGLWAYSGDSTSAAGYNVMASGSLGAAAGAGAAIFSTGAGWDTDSEGAIVGGPVTIIGNFEAETSDLGAEATGNFEVIPWVL
jgi:hypothetical protein